MIYFRSSWKSPIFRQKSHLRENAYQDCKDSENPQSFYLGIWQHLSSRDILIFTIHFHLTKSASFLKNMNKNQQFFSHSGYSKIQQERLSWPQHFGDHMHWLPDAFIKCAQNCLFWPYWKDQLKETRVRPFSRYRELQRQFLLTVFAVHVDRASRSLISYSLDNVPFKRAFLLLCHRIFFLWYPLYHMIFEN